MQFSALRPTRRALMVAFAAASCGIGSLGVAAWAGEVRDEPETVAPVEFGAATPVKPLDSLAVVAPGSLATVVPNSSKVVSPNSLTFVAPAKSELVGVVGFNLNNVARDVALEQIKADTLTPEAAWQSGALTFDNLADLLEHPADPWIINERRTDGGLHHRLIALLLQHEGARLEDLPKVPQRLRLWLADYYQWQRNEKVIEVAESILTEAKTSPTVDNVKFQAIERMAWYYGKEKRFKETAQQWARVPEFISAKGWERADASWLEAESWLLGGEREKADQAFARVMENKDPFFSGASLLTRALVAYRDGDDAQATVLSQSALEQLESSQHSVTAGFRSQTQQLIDTLERWKKEPLISNVRQLRFDFANVPDEQKVLTQKIKIRSARNVPLIVRSGALQVSADVLEQAQSSSADENLQVRLFEEQEIAVTVPRPDKLTNSTTEIKVSSSAFPSFALQIPVEVIYSPFKLSSASLFFGFVDAGKSSKQLLTLNATAPFRVVEVKSDSPAITASFSPSPATQQTVAVIIQGGPQSQILQGKIRIKTDLPAQEVIELPYYAYIHIPS